MRKRIAVLMAALAFTLSSGLAIMTPAQAAKSQCSWGRFCMWSEPNFGGTFSQVLYPTGQCLNSALSNSASSVFNNRPLSTYMQEGPCSDKRRSWLVNSGQSYSTMPSGWDNQMQSFTMWE